MNYSIPLPYMKPNKHAVYPAFIPFAGCPVRCTFCSQEVQTGKEYTPEHIYTALENTIRKDLDKKAVLGKQCEIAFFGGTFTALTKDIQERFLVLANEYMEKGVLIAIRCSTRPDCIDTDTLQWLRGYNMSCIELGVQSFYEPALHATNRLYSTATTVEACSAVMEAGMDLGIQLIVGMPQSTLDTFRNDMHYVQEIAPRYIRLYPCMVFEGTQLATQWKKEEYSVWKEEDTITALIEAVKIAWEHTIHILRIGIAPEKDLSKNILAGLWHSALGMRIYAFALQEYIITEIAGKTIKKIVLPLHCKGFFWGDSSECEPLYALHGIYKHTVTFHNSHLEQEIDITSIE